MLLHGELKMNTMFNVEAAIEQYLASSMSDHFVDKKYLRLQLSRLVLVSNLVQESLGNIR